ncbi:MAG: tetratricopeptide repeat protein, partial [Bryobacteraceae bacterium]
DWPDLYLDFSALCFDHNSFAVGVDMLNAGLARLPREPRLYLARGVLYAQLGQYREADADFSKAEELDPRESAGADAKALADFQADDLDAALAKTREDIRREPRNPFSYYLLAEILTRQGARPGSPEFARAVASAKTAVRLKPDFSLAGDVLSRLYLESGDAKAAIAQCRATLAADPSDQVAIYHLIRALRASPASASSPEIEVLVKRLTVLRAQARQKDAQAGRYKLIEGNP